MKVFIYQCLYYLDELKKDMLNPPKRKNETPKVDKSMKTDEKSQQHDKILSAKGNREADKASTAEEDIEEEVLTLLALG